MGVVSVGTRCWKAKCTRVCLLRLCVSWYVYCMCADGKHSYVVVEIA